MLQATNLECIKGSRLLFRDVSFEVKPGSVLRIEGENGSGKTSLLRLLCSLTKPLSGRIEWKSQDIGVLGSDYHAELAYLAHANGLKDELSTLENLQWMMKLSGEACSDAQLRDALARMGLQGRERLPARVLSQGQKRRTALARFLLTSKPLWLLDEPVASLDSASLQVIEAMLRTHIAKGGMAVLTTHQPMDTPAAATRYLKLTH